MKKIAILFIAFILMGTWVQAQFSHLKEVKLQSAEDFNEYAEQVLDCSDYLLLTPYDKKDVERQVATDFIIRWIQGSPQFSLNVSENIKLLTEEREDLLGLYMTCYAKQILEKEGDYEDNEGVVNNTIHSFLDYCANPLNKIKLTKEMKKLMELKDSGELASLADYLRSMNEAN